ncbi:MAG: ABC transporter substrate-binding protein [Rikenellaceae bacterium]|nr:ABC transporter substrate-binding protein [Rikenellaceae bacterium]
MKRLLFFALLALAGCRHDAGEACGGTLVDISYAKGFTIEGFDGYTVARVRNPWDTTRILHTYILIPRDSAVPSGIPAGDIVRVPVERAVLSSGVHCAMAEALGCAGAVRGVCDPKYVSLPFVCRGVDSGTIADVGKVSQVDIERLLAIEADIIVMSPFGGGGYGALDKAGVPVVECASYMESEPLGQSEWIKFHAAFYGRLDVADSLFESMRERYDSVASLAAACTERPKVLSERRTGQVWYVPGGGSYAAALYRDAATDYPWSDDTSAGSLSLSFEQVAQRASDADVWFIRYHDPAADLTYGRLKGEYELYSLFRPFAERRIFACNTARVPYYETAILNPDKVLSDIVTIAHPQVGRGGQLFYYSPMKR